ncbi:MAG: DUF4157 domain-containing protein [Candidatus Nitrosocosmicus sp.]|nr:DUF4157 domain-containing protein [Candidatus Nitrosocosmicus sp.]
MSFQSLQKSETKRRDDSKNNGFSNKKNSNYKNNNCVEYFQINNKSNFNYSNITIQPKLKVSQPNDPLEREADRIADRIINNSSYFYENGLSNKYFTYKNIKKPKTLKISRKKNINNNFEISNNVTNEMRDIINSGGKYLDTSTKEFMESGLGYDFSRVRIHKNNTALNSAHAMNARAYTVGNHIIFGAGQYSPNTTEGKNLIAHELVHVIQQSNIHSRSQELQSDLSMINMLPDATSIHIFNQPIIARKPRRSATKGGSGNEVLLDNSILVQLYNLHGRRAHEMGITGRVSTIRSIMREFIKGHGQEAWEFMQKKFGIHVYPDPSTGVLAAQRRRAEARNMQMEEKWYKSNDARILAASYERRLPLSTADEAMAKRARKFGIKGVRWSKQMQPIKEGGPHQHPIPEPLRKKTPTKGGPAPTTPTKGGPAPTTPTKGGPAPTTPTKGGPAPTTPTKPPNIKGLITGYGKRMGGHIAAFGLGIALSILYSKLITSSIETQLQEHINRIFQEELTMNENREEINRLLHLGDELYDYPVYICMNFTLRTSEMIIPETHSRVPTIPIVYYDGLVIAPSIIRQYGSREEYLVDEVVKYLRFTITYTITNPKTDPQKIIKP